MKENKLSLESLVNHLELWKKYINELSELDEFYTCVWDGDEEQAYEQIKEMIESYDEMKQEISLLKDMVANPGGLL